MTIVPSIITETASYNLEYISLGENGVYRDVVFAYSENTYNSAIADAFCTIVRDVMNEG
jgi:hypothetical protein